MIPFLKWAGGKRWLFTNDFVANIPPFRRYFEPFLGGGAAFLAIAPRNALLSDINPELIELYRSMKDHPKELFDTLKEYSNTHSKEHYYFVRENIPNTPIERAARTLYLNRTCWNGLYRLNKNGIFNVPIGTKTQIILETDNFLAYSEILQKSDILCQDFEITISAAERGDLVFLDPPYTVKHNMNGFVKYNEKIFSWDDQVRLRNCVEYALNRGVRVILTNADHESIRELYAYIGNHSKRERASVISGKREGRSVVTELMVIA